MDAFNLACDYLAWHNFGTEWFVIIGIILIVLFGIVVVLYMGDRK